MSRTLLLATCLIVATTGACFAKGVPEPQASLHYDAEVLKISGLCAKLVEIKAVDGQVGISVEADGDERDAAKVEVRDGKIASPSIPCGAAGSVVTADGAIVIGNVTGPVTIDSRVDVGGTASRTISLGGEFLSHLHVHVTVPTGMPIDIDVAGADYVVRGRIGAARIAVSGTGTVSADAIGKASVAISGSGKVDLAEVDGPADVSINGDGDVRLHGGDVARLSVGIVGSGTVQVGARVAEATLRSVGSGHILLANKPRVVDIERVGGGNIEFGRDE